MNIFCTISSLDHQAVQVTLVWIPGHVGICGNVSTDKAAPELTLCTVNVPSSYFKRLKSEVGGWEVRLTIKVWANSSIL